jgi:hypothetical protein
MVCVLILIHCIGTPCSSQEKSKKFISVSTNINTLCCNILVHLKKIGTLSYMHLCSVTINIDTLYANSFLHIRNKDIFLLHINNFYTNFYDLIIRK